MAICRNGFVSGKRANILCHAMKSVGQGLDYA